MFFFFLFPFFPPFVYSFFLASSFVGPFVLMFICLHTVGPEVLCDSINCSKHYLTLIQIPYFVQQMVFFVKFIFKWEKVMQVQKIINRI